MTRGPRALLDVDALLRERSFRAIHASWLPERERRLEAWARSLPSLARASVLLVNATKGQALYPSVVDLFVRLKACHPGLSVTSASYFDWIFDLGREVATKGIPVISVGKLLACHVAELNRFDLILAVGPSEALARIQALPLLDARVVCLDLGFYHQLIEGSGGAFLRQGQAPPASAARLRNPVTCYSCQPRDKIEGDLGRGGLLEAERRVGPRAWLARLRSTWTFRWFDYLPVGFAYQASYESDQQPFDVGLLGAAGRRYADLDPEALRGRRVICIGDADRDPALKRLCDELPIEVAPRVDEDRYARLVALCRAVVVPLEPPGNNVFLSVVDALASGKPVLTARLPGTARLERARAPMLFYDLPHFDKPARSRRVLSAAIARALGDDAQLRALGARAVTFARERLDIYRVLEEIVERQLAGNFRRPWF